MCHNCHQQEASFEAEIQIIEVFHTETSEPTMLFTTLSVYLLHLGSQKLVGFMDLGHTVLKTACSFPAL